MIQKVCAILIGYIFGCFQTAFLIGKLNKINIKKLGSKNAGATNIKRLLGLPAGIFVFIIDILKAIIAFCICVLLFKNKLLGVYAGVGVILGHDFPFYLKFNGGKGIASCIGLILVFDFRVALCAYIIAIISIIISRKISIGSLLLSFVMPVILFFLDYSLEIKIIFMCICILAFIRHRENIIKIFSGRESNFF